MSRINIAKYRAIYQQGRLLTETLMSIRANWVWLQTQVDKDWGIKSLSELMNHSTIYRLVGWRQQLELIEFLN